MLSAKTQTSVHNLNMLTIAFVGRTYGVWIPKITLGADEITLHASISGVGGSDFLVINVFHRASVRTASENQLDPRVQLLVFQRKNVATSDFPVCVGDGVGPLPSSLWIHTHTIYINYKYFFIKFGFDSIWGLVYEFLSTRVHVSLAFN